MHDSFDYAAMFLVPFVVAMVPVIVYVLSRSGDWHTSIEKRLSSLEKWRAATTGKAD